MKRRNPKPQFITFSAEKTATLSYALDFLMHSNTVSYGYSGFTHRDAMNAAEKFDDGESVFSNAEMAAAIASVQLVLRAFSVQPGLVAQVEQVFPELIPELKKRYQILQSISQKFQALHG